MSEVSKTLDLIKQSHNNGTSAILSKAVTQATGLVNYDLEAPAKELYPVIAPLIRMIPRVKANGGTAVHWKQVSNINTTRLNPGVSEGNRNATLTYAVADKFATYKGLGFENSLTFEADYASVGFEDEKAKIVDRSLRAFLVAEEQTVLYGLGTTGIGVTPTPSTTTSTTGGSLAASTYSIICVALTGDGFYNDSVANGVLGAVTRTNIDGSVDVFGGGSAQKSAAASQATTGTTSTITAVVAPVVGAQAYAWFWGFSGTELLGAITTINTVVIKASATGTQNASSLTGDNSVNSLVYDGIYTSIFTAGSGSYYYTMPTVAGVGTPLTSDGSGGIVEINNALRSMWDNYRVTPDMMLVNAQEQQNITAKIVASGSTPLYRFNIDAQRGSNVSDSQISAGVVVRSYLNPFAQNGGSSLNIMLHPAVAPGTIMFLCSNLQNSYQYTNVTDPLVMNVRQEYYQREWPLITRRYQYGIYCDETLKNYFPPAFGAITNIANG